MHYVLVVYSRVAGKTHFQPVQYTPIKEQMKTIWATNAYSWDEKTGIHPVYVSKKTLLLRSKSWLTFQSLSNCSKRLTMFRLTRKANTRSTHNQTGKHNFHQIWNSRETCIRHSEPQLKKIIFPFVFSMLAWPWNSILLTKTAIKM